jgi:hypothetical protein
MHGLWAISNSEMGRRGRDRMVVGFTNTYAISAITTTVVSSRRFDVDFYAIYAKNKMIQFQK